MYFVRDDTGAHLGEAMQIMLGKYQLHFGEEPCITGKNGSGTVFFSGCRLGCVFCQNEPISRGRIGEPVSVEQLADIFRELEDAGAHNINLVTGEHYTRQIIEAFDIYRPDIPVVWNSSGYESIENLKLLESYVDVYLPDFKYADRELSAKFSRRADYPDVAYNTITEMLRQKGNPVMNEDGMITRGVIIRHLVLPLHLKNTERVLNIIRNNFPEAWVSLMLQYTPVIHSNDFPELNRKLTEREGKRAIDMLFESGIENGYVQDCMSAGKDLIPDWDAGIKGKIK